MKGALIAARRLEEAGHPVTEAEGVPGLFNVAGIAGDVTIGQLVDIAAQRGLMPVYSVPPERMNR
jgi:hypothetical protein